MTRVKICGIRKKAHAVAATEAGADFIGLVFAPSKRQVTPAEAIEIANAVKKRGDTTRLSPDKGMGWEGHPSSPQVVGVFVNAPPSEVNEIANLCALDWVQLSGDESWEYCLEIVKPIIKAIRIGQQSVEEINAELADGSKLLRTHLRAMPSNGEEERANASSILWQSRTRFITLLDSRVEGKYGGTGLTFNWNLARQVAKRFPVIVAGGLNPWNVAQAIELAAPWGVDVSSGIEEEGVKDTAKIRAFIEAVRRVDASKG
ncbi:MAG: phosphoribosylanthranilate isomerase [Dehalococcoidia bacterium]|nr:phosphoribosylanthranilate isomerase [Dehalococcoidia bacterium]